MATPLGANTSPLVHSWGRYCPKPGSLSISGWFGATSVVMQELFWAVVLTTYWSVCVLTFTSGHELWVVIEKTRSAAKKRLLQRVAGLGLSERLRSSDSSE